MLGESRVLRIGDWRVDPELDQLSREGRTIRVEPRTMQLLLYLAARAGRVIDVQQLLDAVWSNVVVTQGSVYQAIAELRRILGDDREHPSYIENLPRRGYRRIAPVVPWNAGNSAAPSDSTAVGSSPVTSVPIPAQVQSVGASPGRLADTGTEAVAARPLAPERLRRSAVPGGIAQSLEWLETALQLRDSQLINLKTDPLLDPLRQEPRFQAIERELKFPP
jgi:DNA-binding winged helix-turn-helix (wHTH) protein